MNKVQEVTLTIVGAEVAAAHPELHHYTDEHGLFGIVNSNVLRATNFQDLNDSSEVVHLRERLAPELETRFRAILQRRRRLSARVDRAIAQSGGLNKCAADLASDLIRSFYLSAFMSQDGSELSATAGTPYIASLCSHSNDHYERGNGLLSQWRGYGKRSGFCLVFDTQRLAQRLGEEFDAYAYTHLNLSPAHYAQPSLSIGDLFPGLVSCCEEFVEAALNRRMMTNDAIVEFFAAATLLKHQAFREEHEVRIVAIPITDRMRSLIAQGHPGESIRDSRPENPGAKRYIELFHDIGKDLPILRVIVGPSPNQAEQYTKAEALSAGRFEVVQSLTPFRG